MKKIVVAAVIAIWCVPSATLAGERVGDAALGALSGAVVLGPIGAVAGAVIGYTAGPSIATLGELGDPSRDNLRSYPRRLHPIEYLPRK